MPVVPNLPYNCMLLDLDDTPELEYEEIRQIFFKFDKSIFGLEVLIGDRELYTDREVKQIKFFFSGEQIYMKNSDQQTSQQSNFIVEFSQQKFVEADNNANCMNYPSEHQTYNDCDKNYINKVLSTYSPNLIPVWSTQNMTEVSRLLTYPMVFPNHTVSYEDLSDGTQISDCRLPCTQTYVKSRSISFVTNAKDDVLDSISVTFVDNVDVTLYDYPRFQLDAFLSQVTISS